VKDQALKLGAKLKAVWGLDCGLAWLEIPRHKTTTLKIAVTHFYQNQVT
jgi:hypothetical protein